jgi:hypothetical protein
LAFYLDESTTLVVGNGEGLLIGKRVEFRVITITIAVMMLFVDGID